MGRRWWEGKDRKEGRKEEEGREKGLGVEKGMRMLRTSTLMWMVERPEGRDCRL